MNQRITCEMMIGSALSGAIYGTLSVILQQGDSAPVWEVLVSSLGGALLFASAASALCRIYFTWRCLREVARRNANHEMFYRGIPQDLPKVRDRQAAQYDRDQNVEEFRAIGQESGDKGIPDDQSNPQFARASSHTPRELRLTVYDDINVQGHSYEPKHRRVTANRLKQALTELLYESYLE